MWSTVTIKALQDASRLSASTTVIYRHIVLDELHLLLRILDVLIRNLILEMVRLDIQSNQRAGASSASHLERLVSTIRDCRISFSVWEKDADRKPTGVHDWTSLTGADKKLLSTLPEKLPGILPSDISPTVVHIWNVCHTISSSDMYTCTCTYT